MTRKRPFLLLTGLLTLAFILGCSCNLPSLPAVLSGRGRQPSLAAATLTRRAAATKLVPTFTPTMTLTPTPSPTDTPAPTNTPEPTHTPVPTDTPAATETPVPPDTAEPEPPPPSEPTEAPSQPPPAEQPVGKHGVAGKLSLKDGKTDYGVGEDIWFDFEVTNKATGTAFYSILGVAASTGQFQSSWTGELKLNSGETLKWTDKIVLNAPGQHSLVLSMCFSKLDVCQSPNGDWENVAAPVIVKVQ